MRKNCRMIVLDKKKKIALVVHDTDVKALLRIAVVWNIPVACNRASADFMISSPLISEEYERIVPDFMEYEESRKTSF